MGLKYKLSEWDQVVVVLSIEVRQFNMNHEWPGCDALIHFQGIWDNVAVKMHNIIWAHTLIAFISSDILAPSVTFYL